MTDYRERRRREAARGLGLDLDTGRRIPRPGPLDTAARLADLVADDVELLGARDRVTALAALAALSSAESATRSAEALASIAVSLSRLVSGGVA